jgi:hypothetical protein
MISAAPKNVAASHAIAQRPDRRDDHARDRRPGDLEHVERHTQQRVRVAPQGGRDEPGDRPLRGRGDEGVGRPAEEGQEHQLEDPRAPGQHDGRDRALDAARGHVGEDQDPAARHPVGQRAAEEQEQHLGPDVRHQHEAQVGRRPAQTQHGEGQRHRRHRGAGDRQHAAGPEAAECGY